MHEMWYSTKYDDAPMPHAVFFSGGYAVHATDAIKRLGRPASHGCVRLHPNDAADFFTLVKTFGPSNTRIVIVE
jgi:lipoprotein-anchoring transpeptidase ErfK/SrfK